MSNRLVQLELFHLRLPFRHAFSHAAAQRNSTDTVVAAALLSDGTVGFGEGLPRSYVTGETVDSVLFDIGDTLVPCLEGLEPRTFADVLDRADQLPFTNEQGQVKQGRIINSARCCIELALLDAYGKHFGCGLSQIAGWLGYGPFAGGASIGRVRVTGVLDGSEPARMLRRFRLMRWFGLRDFKLKVGCTHDHDNLQLLHRRLRNRLADGRATLRVDANGAWDVDTATDMCDRLADLDIYCIEQPLAQSDRSHLRVLADFSRVPLMADESLLTLDDGEYLAQNDLIDYFNIRISKNGGLIAAIRLAEIARHYCRGFQLGAMVGETGILAAAGRQFLQMVPNTSFTEICYGTFLLKQDLVKGRMRFGYGGKIGALSGPGLGITVEREKISRFLVGTTRKIDLA